MKYLLIIISLGLLFTISQHVYGQNRGLYKAVFTTSDALVGIWSPDGVHIATIQHDQSVAVWDLSSNKKTILDLGLNARTTAVEQFEINKGVMQWDSKGETLAISVIKEDGNYSVQLWDTQTLTLIREMPFSGNPLAFSPDGKLLATTASMATTFWNVETGDLVKSVNEEGIALQWIPEHNILLLAQGLRVTSVSLSTWQAETILDATDFEITYLYWSGDVLWVGGNSKCVQAWYIVENNRAVPNPAICTFGSILDFNPVKHLWAVNSEGGPSLERTSNIPLDVVWIQDSKTAQIIDMIPHSGDVSWLVWSKDGKRLLTITYGFILTIWEEQ